MNFRKLSFRASASIVNFRNVSGLELRDHRVGDDEIHRGVTRLCMKTNLVQYYFTPSHEIIVFVYLIAYHEHVIFYIKITINTF